MRCVEIQLMWTHQGSDHLQLTRLPSSLSRVFLRKKTVSNWFKKWRVMHVQNPPRGDHPAVRDVTNLKARTEDLLQKTTSSISSGDYSCLFSYGL
jgi:hypothetical protein